MCIRDRCYIKPYLGDKIVSRVTRMDIQKLYRKLKHEGRVREHPEHGHELSDTMVLRIHAMLHLSLTHIWRASWGPWETEWDTCCSSCRWIKTSWGISWLPT